MRLLPTALLVATVLLASACTDGRTEDDTETAAPNGIWASPPASVELPCAEERRVFPGPDGEGRLELVADVIALPTAESADRALQTRHDEDAAPPSYFAKTGLFLLAGQAFSIEVHEPPEVARVGWGEAPPTSGIWSDGCAGDGWQAFPGGFFVDEPRCLEVTVSTPDAEETVQVGVGAPCEGQRPPAEPTGP